MVSVAVMGAAALAVIVLVLVTLVIVPPRSVWLGLRSFRRRTGSSPAAVLGAGALGLLVLSFGIAGANTGGGEFTIVDAIPAVLGAFGPLGVAVGLAARRTAGRLDAASDCRTGSPGTGVVAVDGALQAVDGTFEIPDTDGGVLHCTYALQEDRGFASSSPAWASLAEGTRTRPLAVDDGSGPVRIDEDAVSVRAARLSRRSYSVSLPEDEPVADEVAAFLSTVGVDAPERPDRDHRLRLAPLGPGNTVSAVGEYDRVTKPGDAFWGISDGDDPAYLFPGDLGSVRARLARRYRWLTGGGALFTLVGVGYVATLFVP
jgi:hypothetical protein